MEGDTRPIDADEPSYGVSASDQSDADAARATGGLELGTSTIAVWIAIVVALVGFLLVGRVSVHPDGFERTMRVADVWTAMGDELPNVSRQSILKTGYYAAIVATLLGAFAAILIALAARDPATSADPDQVTQRTEGTLPDAAGRGD